MTTAEKTRLLAEGVMGWEFLPGDSSNAGDMWKRGHSYYPMSWSPLTDLSDAGEVLEAMRAKGWRFELGSHGVNRVYANFGEVDGDDISFPRFPSFAITLPAAICNAALLALGLAGEEEL